MSWLSNIVSALTESADEIQTYSVELTEAWVDQDGFVNFDHVVTASNADFGPEVREFIASELTDLEGERVLFVAGCDGVAHVGSVVEVRP